MNLSKVDLNLFIVFDAIYTEANLTRAGQIVGITQPAVSNALARLRETFNDPLFVRTAQGMVPTPMAQNIIGPVRNALSLLRVSVQESRIFNPLQAVKTYRISMTDLTEAVILPPLFQRLRRLAPTVAIESFLSKRRETTKELAAGRLDFAVDAPLNTDPRCGTSSSWKTAASAPCARATLWRARRSSPSTTTCRWPISISPADAAASAMSTWPWARWASSARSPCAPSIT